MSSYGLPDFCKGFSENNCVFLRVFRKPKEGSVNMRNVRNRGEERCKVEVHAVFSGLGDYYIGAQAVESLG
jgi:hypothetical protein